MLELILVTLLLVMVMRQSRRLGIAPWKANQVRAMTILDQNANGPFTERSSEGHEATVSLVRNEHGQWRLE